MWRSVRFRIIFHIPKQVYETLKKFLRFLYHTQVRNDFYLTIIFQNELLFIIRKITKVYVFLVIFKPLSFPRNHKGIHVLKSQASDPF